MVAPRLSWFGFFVRPLLQSLVPVLGGGLQPMPVAASSLRDFAQTESEGLALRVGVGGGDKLRIIACRERADRRFGSRRPANARAEVQTALA